MLVVHNMSVPSRTEVRAEKRGIADRIVVFSLVYALIVSGFLETARAAGKAPKREGISGSRARDYSSDLRVTIRARWPSPGDLFARIGDPKTYPNSRRFPDRLASRHFDRWLVIFVPIRKLLPECKLAARVISTSPAATPI